VSDPGSAPYLAALRLLGRRELSEAQIRARLVRRQYDEVDIDQAITRLKSDRSLDDARVAAAIARTEVALRLRGRRRVRRQIEAAGIAPELAARAVEDTFAEVDEDALLARAFEKARRGRTGATDERERGRLYRLLLGQGFEADRVLARLRKPHRLE